MIQPSPDMVAHAIEVLRKIDGCRQRHTEAVAALSDLHEDFCWLSPIPTAVESAVVGMLDAILGEALASYYLYECDRSPGRIIEGGNEWPIASVDDLVAYLSVRGR